MKRILSDWVNSYVQYMRDTEWPVPYHIWNAISCVAGALQRKVWMPWGMDKIFPNMYIVLVGRSGLGKGRSMGPAIDMFSEQGLPVVADAITLAELLKYMGEKEAFYEYPTGNMVPHCSVQVFAKELAVLLGQKDMKKLAHLTDLYDSHDTWKNATKGCGKDELLGVCLNLIGASAPDWFPTILPIEAMGGGFTSRIIFVVESVKAKIVPRPIYTKEHLKLKRALTEDLGFIAAKCIGPLEFTEKAYKLYEGFYLKHEADIKEGIWPVKDTTFRGYCERRPLHLRKLSMAFAASRGSLREVTELDFKRALEILKNAELKMPRIFGGVGANVQGAVTNKIIMFLLEAQAKGKKCKRSEILRAFYQDIDNQKLQIVEATLIKMGFFKLDMDQSGDAIYTVNPKWEEK